MEVPQPVDEGEHVPSRLAELREDFQGVQGVEDEEPIVEGFADALRVQLEQIHPWLLRRAGELLPQHPQVQDAQVPVRVLEAIPESFRVIDEARAALLQGHIQTPHPVQRVRVEDVVGERGLHRPWCPRHEDDTAVRDAAAEDIVQAFHLRGNPLHSCPSAISSSFWRIDSICCWMRFFSWGTSTTSARLPRSTVARSAIRTRSVRSISSGFFPILACWVRRTPSTASPSCSKPTRPALSNRRSRSLTASAAANSSSISFPFQ